MLLIWKLYTNLYIVTLPGNSLEFKSDVVDKIQVLIIQPINQLHHHLISTVHCEGM